MRATALAALLLAAGAASAADDVWVAVTVAGQGEDAPEYYGTLAQADLDALIAGSYAKAFFPLAAACWADDDDRIEDLADDRFAGRLLLRVADLRRIAPLTGDPHDAKPPAKPRGKDAAKPGVGAAQPKF